MWLLDKLRTKENNSNMSSRSEAIDTSQQSIDPLVVLPANIIQGRITDAQSTRTNNRYALADNLCKYDERLYSAIELMALMIKKSIGEASIKPKNKDDRELTNEEQNAVKIANQFMEKLNVAQLFYNYTIDLWKYGDAVDIIHYDGDGIYELEPIPMSNITAIDNKSQIGKFIDYNDAMIKRPNWYLLGENLSDMNSQMQIFGKNRILHISFNPRRNQIRDNIGRWTMNVWSSAPIESLIAILQWKQILIRNNILWSNRAVPREHHILDLSQFDISKFSGDFKTRQSASIQAAENAIKNYNDQIQRRESDQGYVTGRGVEIKYIEPKTKSTDDMPILNQINELINGPTGTPSALMGGETKGFASLVHSASFLALRAESYADVIQKKMEELMKRHVSIARPNIRTSVVERLFIKNRLILDRDRAELAKIIAVLVESQSFTMDEVRTIWGHDPMTEKQLKEHLKMLRNLNKSENINQIIEGGERSEDILRRTGVNPTGEQESPGKRDNDLIQTGKSAI